VRVPPAWDDLPVRPELRGARPYGAPQFDLPVRLNTNENPYPPPPVVQEAMAAAAAEACKTINRYPDRELTRLRAKLAAYLGHGLVPEQIWAANGSNEVMVQILQAFGGPGRSVLTFTPSYSMYPEYARDTHTEYLTLPRNAELGIDMVRAREFIAERRPDVIVIATPNNPTGTVIELGVIEELLELSPGILVVDEAYQEFSTRPTALTLLPRYGQLIVVRTMSKAFAFAGERVGYLAAAAAIVNALRIVRLPYHLSAITQAVAAAAVDHAADMLAQIEHLRELRDQAVARARAMGLTVPQSEGNFFLCGPFADRHAAWQGLVDQGVLVRETGPDKFLRVSVGTDQEMDVFFAALAEVWGRERQES